MRLLLFIFLLAGTVTTAIIWNQQLCFQVDEGTQKETREAIPTDEVTVVIGIPPGGTAPTKKPRVKPPQPKPQPQPQPRPKPISPVTRTAFLRDGETVYGLAGRILGNSSRYKEILKLNGLTEKEATNLKIGAKLKIPAR